MKMKFMTVSLAAILASVPAMAASDDVVVLSNWGYDALYEDARSVDQLISSAELFGPEGNEIGSVENVIFSDDGEARAIIAEVGGFWDIGDTHVTVPWDQVDVDYINNRVEVPVTEESVSDYSGFYDDYLTTLDADGREVVDDDLETGPFLFKATDLIGDYAALSDRTPYGYVRDVLIGFDGDISAVVVDASAYGTPGYYAYPYNADVRGGAYSPYYGLPYDRTQIDTLEQFDYDMLNNSQS